jgi:hypothetical protein
MKAAENRNTRDAFVNKYAALRIPSAAPKRRPLRRMRQEIAKGSGENVGEPKGEDRIGAEGVNGGDQTDKGSKDEDIDIESPGSAPCREVASGVAKRRGEENGRLGEELPPGHHNRVDR